VRFFRLSCRQPGGVAAAMEADPPTVFLVEDDADLRDGLRLYLGTAGFAVRAYSTAEGFLADYRPGFTGCLITDVHLPKMDGVSLIDALNRAGRSLPVFVISGFAGTALVVQAMRAGAVDFLEKPLDLPAALEAVRQAMNGLAGSAGMRSEASIGLARMARLSLRERDVFARIAAGASTKQVAADLDLSPKTVETYRTRLFEKLGVHTPHALLRLAVLTALAGPVPERHEERDIAVTPVA
jgi:FixJ family two-component response regulator